MLSMNYGEAAPTGRQAEEFKAVLCALPSESPDAFAITPRVPSGRGPNRIIKIGIVALIKAMEAHGYSRDNYDYYDVDTLLPTDEDLIEYFGRVKPMVVGLSAVVSTSYMQVKRIAEIVRRVCPDCWIVVGGNLSASANVVIAKTEVDLCVYGDGEVPWVSFLDYVRSVGRKWDWQRLEKIPGLVYVDHDGELNFTGHPPKNSIQKLVLPDYDILEMGLQGQSEKLACYFGTGSGDSFGSVDPRSFEPGRRPNSAFLPTSKGCVAKCTFCQRTFKGYRTAELEELEEHIQMLQEKFDVGFLSFADENFGSDREFAREVAKLMKKYDILWSGGGTRVSSIKPDDVRFFKEHNCLGFIFGIESGSPTMLDVMEKRFNVDTIWKTLEVCIELNMNTPLNFLTGMPGETEQTAIETGRFVGEIAHKLGIHPKDSSISVAYAMPFPGTPLYEYAQQVGLIGTSIEDEEDFLIRIGRGRVNKFNYLNSNGAPAKESLFWDVLIEMEASRHYRELSKRNPTEPGLLGQTLRERTEKLTTVLLESSDNYLVRLRRALIRNAADNKLYDFFPRWIAYPLVKNLFYLDHLAKRMVFRMTGRIYTFGTEKRVPKRINVDAKTPRERSLRWVIQKGRRPPETKTEKVLIALRSAI